MLTKNEQKEYLESQKRAVEKQQFISSIGNELAKRRMEKAIKDKKYEDAAALEEQIKKTAEADLGNEDYLELLDELLRDL